MDKDDPAAELNDMRQDAVVFDEDEYYTALGTEPEDDWVVPVRPLHREREYAPSSYVEDD